MALSCLLRGALNGCKIKQSIGLPSKYSTISSVAYQRLKRYENSVILPTVAVKTPTLFTGIRYLSTSPVKTAGTTPAKAGGGHGDHSKLWTLERLLSVGLLGILPLGIKYPNILFDLVMAVSIVMHAHWGIEAIVADYIRSTVFGPLIPKLAQLSVYVFSVFLLVGLLNLIFLNAGLGNSIQQIWKI